MWKYLLKNGNENEKIWIEFRWLKQAVWYLYLHGGCVVTVVFGRSRHCRCRTSMAKAKISIPFSQRGPIPIQLEDSYTGNPTGCAVIDIIFPQGEQVSHHWCKTFSYQMFRKATATEVHTYTGLVYTNARKVSYLWYSCWWKPEQDWKMPLLLISDFRGSIS